MARLESQSKLLYYPTDPRVVSIVASYFAPIGNPDTVFVDPCAGKGIALKQLAALLAMPDGALPRTWGIELSTARAKDAREALDTVAEGDFYLIAHGESNWVSNSVGLIFNNPPYDWSGQKIVNKATGESKDIRHEVEFIRICTGKLVPGGHQIIIVPRGILSDVSLLGKGQEGSMARYLLGHYEKVIVGYVDTEDYHKYNQIVVLAIGKRKFMHPDQDAVQAFLDIAREIPPLLEWTGDKFAIPASKHDVKLSYIPADDEYLYQQVLDAGIYKRKEIAQALAFRKCGEPFHPATPLGIGHISALITSQQAGVLILTDENGNKMIVKGQATKVATQTRRDNHDERGRTTSVSVAEKEKFTSVIAIVKHVPETGKYTVEMITSVDAVRDFILKYVAEMSKVILEKNSPIYNWDYTDQEWELLDKIGLGLKRLVGRKEHGMFVMQRHATIAALRVLRVWGTVLLSMEMGYGKTLIVLAILYSLNLWPVLLVGPTHMVYKYLREFQQGSIKDDPVTVVVIDRSISDEKHIRKPAFTRVIGDDGQEKEMPIMKVATDRHGNIIMDKIGDKWKPRMVQDTVVEKINQGQYSKLLDRIVDLGGTVKTVGYRQVISESHKDSGNRRKIRVTYPREKASEATKLIEALKFSYLADGKKEVIQPSIASFDYDTEMVTKVIEYVDRDPMTFEFFMQHRKEFWPEKVIVVAGFDSAKYDAGYSETPATRKKKRPIARRKDKYVYAIYDTCPGCGADVSPGEKMRNCPKCKSPLFNFNRWHRTGIGKMILSRYKGIFPVYISDEVHKGKSIDTDVGVLDSRLIEGTKFNIGLTGTLFGGTADSLFALLYRRSKAVRDAYPYLHGLKTWVEHFGLYLNEWSEPKVSGYGSSTNVKRIGMRTKILPGVSPAVMEYLLPITIFGNITDLGYELPPMKEEIIMMNLKSGLHASQINWINNDLLDKCVRFAREHNDPGALACWWINARCRPMSAFRDEFIHYESKKTNETISFDVGTVLSNEDELLPKEETMADLVIQGTRAGRRTLIYVEQTHTRDIRERLRTIISKRALGLETGAMLVEVGQLSANSMKPAQREKWITLEAPKMDAMVVHPGLVETGLDLVMFHNIIFYEMNTSLYRVWQAMRRVWRLGQTQEVNTYILGYNNTVEAEILARMGKKMKYAYLLYGKDASGVLVEEDEDTATDNLMKEIIDDALAGKAFRTADKAVESIFGNSEKQEAPPSKPRKHIVVGGNGNGNGKVHAPVEEFVPVIVTDVDTGEQKQGELIVANSKQVQLSLF